MTERHQRNRALPVVSGERGYTLVEMLVAVALAGILLSVGLAIGTTFFRAESTVDTTYQNLNQLLPVGTSFQQFIRSAVSPAPTTAAGQPVPPFGTYASTGALNDGISFTPNSLTFFTNIGTSTITINGAKYTAARVGRVTAALTITPKTVKSTVGTKTEIPATTASVEAITPSTVKYVLTVKLSKAKKTTCPTPTTLNKRCSTFTTSNESSTRNVFTVDNVTNSSVFTYYYHWPTPKTSAYTTDIKYASTGEKITPGTELQNCTKTLCPADHIGSVGIDLIVSENPHVGQSADEETVTYQVSSSSQAFSSIVG